MNAPGFLRDMAPPRLALIELLDREGGVAHRVPVHQWPVRIGRSLACDVVLDDPHVAPEHALIELVDGAPVLRVLDTVNGVRLGAQTLARGTQEGLPPSSELTLGRSRLRLRLPGEALAPELALHASPAPARTSLAIGLLALLLWLAGGHLLEADPGDPLSEVLPVLVGLPVALAGWSGLWALGSKLFHRQFEFIAHLRIALGVLLASLVLGAALPLAGFMTGGAWLGRVAELLPLGLGCWLVYRHLKLIVPQRRHALAVGFATMFLVGTGVKLLLNQQRTDRWFNQLYLSTLGPPALRLAPTLTPEAFLDDARSLRAPLEHSAADPDGPDDSDSFE